MKGSGDLQHLQHPELASRQQSANRHRFFCSVEYRRRADHRRRWDTKKPRFLKVALAFWQLIGAKGANTTGEHQARSFAGALKIEAGKEAIGIVPLSQAGRAGCGMVPATEYDNGIGFGSL